jgi:hypothetical protein
MNDIRMELSNTAMYGIRRAAFVVKSLGKGYYPEAILGIRSPLLSILTNPSPKSGDDAERTSQP